MLAPMTEAKQRLGVVAADERRRVTEIMMEYPTAMMSALMTVPRQPIRVLADVEDPTTIGCVDAGIETRMEMARPIVAITARWMPTRRSRDCADVALPTLIAMAIVPRTAATIALWMPTRRNLEFVDVAFQMSTRIMMVKWTAKKRVTTAASRQSPVSVAAISRMWTETMIQYRIALTVAPTIATKPLLGVAAADERRRVTEIMMEYPTAMMFVLMTGPKQPMPASVDVELPTRNGSVDVALETRMEMARPIVAKLARWISTRRNRDCADVASLTEIAMVTIPPIVATIAR